MNERQNFVNNGNQQGRVSEQLDNQRVRNENESQARNLSGMQDYQRFKKDFNHSKHKLPEKKEFTNVNNQSNNNSSSSSIEKLNNPGKNTNPNVSGKSLNSTKTGAVVGGKNGLESKVAENALQGMGVPKSLTRSVLGNKRVQNILQKRTENPFFPLGAAGLSNLLGLNKKEDTNAENDNDKDESSIEDVSFKLSTRAKRILLWASPPIAMVIIFCCLFISASQTYVNISGLGAADKVEESELSKDDEWYETGKGSTEIDAVESKSISSEPKVTLLAVKEKNEITLDQLNDLFGGAVKCENKNCSNTPEFKFYVKMYDIYKRYKKNYNIKLDLSLLMATLSIGEDQIVNVFSKNLNEYNRDQVYDTGKDTILNIDWEYDYKNISNYTYLSSKDFSYDMQILAKAMVKKTTTQKCTSSSGEVVATKEAINVEDANLNSSNEQYLNCPSGSTYSASSTYKYDEENYKEFLKEFFEFKFYIDDSVKEKIYVKKPNTNTNINNNNTNTGVNIKNGEYIEDKFSKKIYYYNQCSYKSYYMSTDPANYEQYKGRTICTSGCGPTSMAIVVSTFKQANHDPIELTAALVKNKGYMGNGSIWAPMQTVLKSYGLNVQITYDIETVRSALKTNNALVISSMNKGNFTNNKHFIVLAGYNSNGETFVVDPNNGGRKGITNKYWSFDDVIVKQSKGYFIVTE